MKLKSDLARAHQLAEQYVDAYFQPGVAQRGFVAGYMARQDEIERMAERVCELERLIKRLIEENK